MTVREYRRETSENAHIGIIVSMGGQTALNVGIELWRNEDLQRRGIRVLGTKIDAIVATEDREIFSTKLREINETLALSYPATTVEGALEAAHKIGYPVLVRAAFTLGGLGSGFAENDAELRYGLRRLEVWRRLPWDSYLTHDAGGRFFFDFGADRTESRHDGPDAVRDGSKSTKRPPTACSPPDAIDATRKKINRRRGPYLVDRHVHEHFQKFQMLLLVSLARGVPRGAVR